ncbi:MAG: M24 family metallopeptidase [Anaerolineae bacterium]
MENLSTTLQQWRVTMAREGLDAAIVTHPLHVAYLTGYLPPADRQAALLVAADKAVLVAPTTSGLKATDDVSLVVYEDLSFVRPVDVAANAARALAEALPVLNYRDLRLGLELDNLSTNWWTLIQRTTQTIQIIEIGALLRRQRLVKNEAEIKAIERSVSACDHVFAAIERSIRAGASELDVYGIALRTIAEDAGGCAVLEGDFVSGERTEEIGGPPTTRVLRSGELLIVDVLPRLGMYWGDCTRTFVVGQATEAMLQRHALLEAAMAAGERAIRPGRRASEVYQAVRAVLAGAGLGDCFPHHAGHAIGLAGAEDPRLVPEDDTLLQEGMVLTLEPGVYVPGEGGMRLEDNLVVTADGCRSLNSYPRRLVSLKE